MEDAAAAAQATLVPARVEDDHKELLDNFAKRGFPYSFGTPFWPRFNDVTQQMQSLVPPTPQTETDFAATHMSAFWAAA